MECAIRGNATHQLQVQKLEITEKVLVSAPVCDRGFELSLRLGRYKSAIDPERTFAVESQSVLIGTDTFDC
jgi:hypothetical protein